MNRYIKVLNENNQIVDALSQINFVKWDERSNMVVVCPAYDTGVMGMLSYDISTIWHIAGKPQFPESRGYITTTYTEIDKEEFEILRKALDEKSEEDDPIDDITPDPIPDVPDDDEQTLALVINSKLLEMNKVCNTIITQGIDVVLSDGNSHHFSLTEYDQLNIFKLETLARSGEMELLPYHEDDELCKFYPAVDIVAIADAATSYITYHTTYCNSLKSYIKSLNSISSVASITYGVEIPEEFQSDVWKELNKNG